MPLWRRSLHSATSVVRSDSAEEAVVPSVSAQLCATSGRVMVTRVGCGRLPWLSGQRMPDSELWRHYLRHVPLTEPTLLPGSLIVTMMICSGAMRCIVRRFRADRKNIVHFAYSLRTRKVESSRVVTQSWVTTTMMLPSMQNSAASVTDAARRGSDHLLILRKMCFLLHCAVRVSIARWSWEFRRSRPHF